MAWQGVEGHDDVAARFITAAERGRVAGSYLFVGPPGVGKDAFARSLAKALLCSAPAGPDRPPLTACGRCGSCVQAEAGTHPDIDIVAKPEDRATIPLEAFIGALYLDGGPQKARAFVTSIMGERLSGSFERLEDFDARSHLIRVCVREWSRPPLVEISSQGAAHEPVFTAVVVINGEELGRAEGRSKKIAAQAASVAALGVLAARGVDTSRA